MPDSNDDSAGSNGNVDTHGDGYTHSNSHGYIDPNQHTHGNEAANAHGNYDPNRHTHTDRY